ncbi:flagellar hook protein FlgE [Buchnera aphidicola (Brachycaudus cardui)]|uniref:Flagellar hook protein FlgE n=1 Tax=Buchnera aphidicola (Brachycaudus cardui) TaxID=557993 RepID=A0A4D6Y865_9GAMM|nr:flagellar hook protein FlgE [Buchnera aphidicola]QCI20475.1 flagellar hook protein FlgE [Buchnera aphidicola (Brachycaudus cardui)]
MTSMAAISGLLINNDYINIISNNIANASTIGYKSSQPVFFNIFSNSMYSNSVQGSGVGISHIIQNFNSGMLVETGRDLDLGIIRDGFFRVLDPRGHVYYTRNGQFLLDQNQNIINTQGMYLTGQNKSFSKNTFNNLSNLEPINLQHAHILKAKPTSSITLSAILNNNIDPITNTDDPDHDLSKSANYVSNITIYNKDDKPEEITISFKKIDNNTWKVHVKSKNNVETSAENNIDNSFDLKFNSSGELISKELFNIRSKNAKYEDITLNLTGTVVENSDSDNSFQEFSQDGYSQGSLKAFNILSNGEIIGTYSNKQTVPIGQILLSKFTSPEKLRPESGNVWSATAESGQGDVGIAGDSGFGVLTERTLETSNVDLNKELINMIIAQRNYQSNAQSFKTEDKIINTLINLR